MASLRTLDQGDFSSKRVICRVDFNVPLSEGRVVDDMRIRSSVPTIKALREQGARVIIVSHTGRPKGDGYEEAFSNKPIAERLSQLIDAPVELAHDVVGPDAQAKAAALKDGEVLLLENVRFDKREKENDEEFCKELASLGEVFVNDAFGAAHRAHGSMFGITSLLPSYAGKLMQVEVETLSAMLDNPQRPFTAILGGSKVSDKVAIIDALIDKCDCLIIGGGMCFTFLLAQGKTVGSSLKEEDWVERAHDMIKKAEAKGVKLLLPTDVVVADAFSNDARTETVSVDEIPNDMMGLDIGPETAAAYGEAIAGAKTVFWNGPMGVFEMPSFEAGTKAVAQAVADNTEATTVIGGGDSVCAVNKFDLSDKMSFVSTGGGASMKFVEGNPLPCVEALKGE